MWQEGRRNRRSTGNWTRKRACPIKGRGGRSETPTTSPDHCVRDKSRRNQPIIREQGPRGGCGGAVPHERALAITEPQDEPSKGGRRGRPNNKKYEGRRPKRDHSFLTMPTIPNRTLRRYCNTREQSHLGHYISKNNSLHPDAPRAFYASEELGA